MEKKFKCKDEILLKNKEAEYAMWFYAIFSNYCKNNTFITISGGITYDLDFFDILPYEGNEHLVGTTDEPYEDDEEIKLEKGERIICNDDVNLLIQGVGFLTTFSYGDGDTFRTGKSRFVEEEYNYAIKFSDFNPNSMEATKAKILSIKGGKIVRYKG